MHVLESSLVAVRLHVLPVSRWVTSIPSVHAEKWELPALVSIQSLGPLSVLRDLPFMSSLIRSDA